MPVWLIDIINLGDNPVEVLRLILRNGGLIIFFPILVWMCKQSWMQWIQMKYLMKKKFVLLAIDVPKLNEQSMRAVELIISALHGVHFGPNKIQKYWIGVMQDKFSLEIVSIDGYIQYFIQCDNYNADLVKGAVYAQYPEAEIIEVEDYTQNVPQTFPNETHDAFTTQFVLANSDVYPIKTYEFFEHNLTGIFADPIAAILELLGRLRPGEQVWLQMVITPEGIGWRDKSLQAVADLIGKKIPQKKTIMDFVTQIPISALELTHDAVFTTPEDSGKSSQQKSSDESGDFMKLTTGEKINIEEIQKKAARLHFNTKFRFVYIAPKDVFDSWRVVGSVFGAVKQFNALDLNSFRAGARTISSGPTYLFASRRREWRMRKMMLSYKYRSNWSGDPSFVMSHTEIATVFHFPSENVQAPLVSTSESKKAEPPSRLPVENPFGRLRVGHERLRVDEREQRQAAAEDARIAAENQDVYGDIPLPPAPPVTHALPPAAPAVEVVQSPQHGDYPLHSMPGLPPGVRPVQPQVQQSPQPTEAYVPVQPQQPQPTAPVRGGGPPPNLPI